ncbi:TolC family outer membrane protein [Thioalkalivibrio halophilus]|uniref:Type I secretion protein TolC n=1 Tax=Thioalkalivibrio halophilus TaxID=252474 RepID=A0A1V3A1L0_9GAMM|nr:TolC family outer membrane protein [Thioalkalivibrio halophilus]OOC11221.1 type I secretion protein TolC [Thioalkalivibrio halophilus]
MKRLHPLLAAAGLALFTAAPAQGASLMEVYEQAAREDAELQIAEAEYRSALQNRPAARSGLLPQLRGEIEGGAFYNDPDGRDSTDGRQSRFALLLDQSIYDRRNYVELSQADLEIARSEAERDAARQDLMLRVSEAYFDVLVAQEGLEFSIAELEAIERQLEQTERRFDVGLIASTDVKEARAQRDLAEAQRIAAENELNVAREQLALITNRYWDELDTLAPDAELQLPQPRDADAWVQRALENNLELAAQRLATETAREQIERQRAEGLPRLGLNASVSENRFHSVDEPAMPPGQSSQFNDSTEAQVGIRLEIPLYTGGRVTALTRQAREDFQAAQQGQTQVERMTRRDTRNAYLASVATESRVRALNRALESTQAAFEAAEAGFEVGTRTQVDVLLALREVFGAERDFAEARYDFLANTLRLERAAGQLTEEDLESIDAMLD